MSFEKRPAELEEAAAPLAYPEFRERQRALYPARAAVLEQALAIIGDTGSDPKTREINNTLATLIDRWLLPFQALGRDWRVAGFGTSSDTFKTSYQLYVERETAREMAFFQALVNAGVGEARDAMIDVAAGLAKMIDDLQHKWDAMSDAAKALDAIEAGASDQMNKIVVDVQRNAVDGWVRVGKALDDLLAEFALTGSRVNAALVAGAKECGMPAAAAELIPKSKSWFKDYFLAGQKNGIPATELAKANPEVFRDPGTWVVEQLQRPLGPVGLALCAAVMTYYQYISPYVVAEYSKQITAIKEKFPNQGALLVTFTETRKDVDRFLRENGLAKAREIFEAADRGLKALESMPTDGLESDAVEWTGRARDALQRRYEAMASAFGVFVQANQGKFLGGVSKEVENNLIFTDVWYNREHGWLNEGLDEKLLSWRDAVGKIDDIFSKFSVGDAMRDVPDEYFPQVAGKLNEYMAKLRKQVGDEVKTAQDTLASAHEVFKKDATTTALNRQPLASQLNG